jgi:glycosyltransferase involved in cell wall biosynthesis
MLVPVEDAERLQEAMLRCAADVGHAGQLAQAARTRVEKRYSIRGVAMEYADLYAALLLPVPATVSK